MPFFLFVILFSLSVSSQKKYVFDYMLEYKFQKNDTVKVTKVFMLINSRDRIKGPIYNLEKFSKINKYLIVNKECNYTDKEKFKMTRERKDYLFIGELTYTKRDY